tara:strand:- start:689028 stop:690635 length:1608 start_codon:yes stop_codon:yes gene_type:complete
MDQATIIKDPGSVQIKRALISVSNKSEIERFASELVKRGIKIIATQGTVSFLKEKGIDAEEISDYTGMPELMEGRVKTLHPKIHGGILAQKDKAAHREALLAHDIQPIELVVVNLDGFVDIIAESDDEDACLDHIDIGGLAMIRSAAKNYKNVTVVTDPKDYQSVLDDLAVHDGGVTQGLRKRLAANAFSLTATYDANISGWFQGKKTDSDFPARYSVSGTLEHVLRYGENPQQKAALYNDGSRATGVVNAKHVQGQDLSYNNVIDADAGFKLVSSFEAPCVAIIKHGNPCGVACAEDTVQAYERALKCDPLSARDGCVSLNRPLDLETAEIIVKMATKVIIAPSVASDALDFLGANEDLHVLATGEAPEAHSSRLMTRSLTGGFLVQEPNNIIITADDLEIVTERSPTENELADLLFAFNVCKYVTSNAIVYVKDAMCVGIGAGQASRTDAALLAARKAKAVSEMLDLEHSLLRNSVVASDGFFTFADSLITAADAGVTAIIQPGGSAHDKDVIAAADDRAIAMVFTKIRNFKH